MNLNSSMEGIFDDQPVSDQEQHIKQFRELWRMVILQAIIDAINVSKQIKRKRVSYKALKWLQGDSHDFREVCYYAGLDPKLTAKKIHTWIQSQQFSQKKEKMYIARFKDYTVTYSLIDDCQLEQ